MSDGDLFSDCHREVPERYGQRALAECQFKRPTAAIGPMQSCCF
jgi:hypothetical protein